MLNPLEVYPEAWHSSLRPVMVCANVQHDVATNHMLTFHLGSLL